MDINVKLLEGLPDLAQLAFVLLLGAGGGWTAVALAWRKQRRVLANLHRPILVIGTGETRLADQHRLLCEIGLFNVSDRFEGAKAADSLDGQHRLLVLGFSKDSAFKLAFDRARNLGVPVLVYARHGSATAEDMDYITNYSYATVCNTDMRLISDVFAVMSTFPEKK